MYLIVLESGQIKYNSNMDQITFSNFCIGVVVGAGAILAFAIGWDFGKKVLIEKMKLTTWIKDFVQNALP